MTRTLFRSFPFLLPFLLLLPASAGAQTEEPRFSGRFFADMSYLTSERTMAQGFRLGQLVAHGSAAITDHLAFFGEATATARGDGYAVEVERSIVRYDFSDAFKLGAGRFHTPLGHWNTAYHHGVWLQSTVGRPEMFRPDRAMFPTHFVGLVVEGATLRQTVGMSYAAGVGNGRASVTTRAGDAGDVNANKARLAALTFSPPKLSGMRAGVSIYEDVLTPTTGANVSVRLGVAHVALDRGSLEFASEALVLRHHARVSSSRATENHAGYALLAYRLPGPVSSFKPYARYDRVAPSANDVVFAATPMDMSGYTAGVRYDFAPLAALKTEFRRERMQSRLWRNTAVVQFSITFPGVHGNSEPHVAQEEHDSSHPTSEGR